MSRSDGDRRREDMMKPDVSENISENRGRVNRTRGRPPVLSPDVRAAYQNLWSEIKSARGLQNKHYQARAQAVLTGEPGMAWLIDLRALQQGKPGNYRQTILQALGRIRDEEDLITVARIICEQRPTARHALAMIRRVRLGQSPAGDVHQLTDVLRRTLNTYLSEHARMRWEAVLEALDILAFPISEVGVCSCGFLVHPL